MTDRSSLHLVWLKTSDGELFAHGLSTSAIAVSSSGNGSSWHTSISAKTSLMAGSILQVNARLTWRVELPQNMPYPKGKRFATPARFLSHDEHWPQSAWSLIVEAESPVVEDRTQRVRVWFFVEDAPHHWLSHGSKFELYEGRLLLADGIVE